MFSRMLRTRACQSCGIRLFRCGCGADRQHRARRAEMQEHGSGLPLFARPAGIRPGETNFTGHFHHKNSLFRLSKRTDALEAMPDIAPVAISRLCDDARDTAALSD